MSHPRFGVSRRSHPKSRNGCQRCKSRKVKCDEARPSCAACTRHGVVCVYRNSQIETNVRIQEHSQNLEDTPHSRSQGSSGQATPLRGSDEDVVRSRNTLELRLLHQFLVYTCHTISPIAQETWVEVAPPLAFQHEFLLNAMMAIAALHLERTNVKYAESHKRSEQYMQRTLEGHQNALANICDANAEAAVFTSGLISLYTIAKLNNPSESATDTDAGYLRWLRVGRGAAVVFDQRRDFFIRTHAHVLQVPLRTPNLSSNEANFAAANRENLQHLLDWGAEFESISHIDREAYEHALSFIGLIYKVLDANSEPTAVVCRRISASPSVFPPRFVELVQERRPRALAMVAYLFASAKLVKEDVWWLKGVAETQVPIIHELLPSAWKAAIEVPLSLAQNVTT